MTKEQVKSLIQNLFNNNIKTYPEHYSNAMQATEAVLDFANQIHSSRTTKEIKRDISLNITIEQYEIWGFDALEKYNNSNINI